MSLDDFAEFQPEDEGYLLACLARACEAAERKRWWAYREEQWMARARAAVGLTEGLR